MQTLLDDLSNYLKKEITVDTCSRIKGIAEEYYLENLKLFVEDYICMHFKDFSGTEDFKVLTYNEVQNVYIS